MMTRHHPPRIVHVIYALSTGGLENGLVNIINHTPPGRFEHIIVCITTADDFAGRITAKGVKVIELNKREGHDLRFYWRLWILFRQLRPDIIHSRNLAALETQLLSITNRGVKRVHGEHGREINDLDGTNRKYLAFRRFMRRIVHHYITVSKDLERWLQETVEVSPDKISQIYNGVNQDRFSPGGDTPCDLLPASWCSIDDRLVVGTVGRLTPVKDQRSLLLALDFLRANKPQLFKRVCLLIVGDGPLRESLEKEARELKLEAHVWFAGNRSDIPDLLKAMDVFLLPSLGEGVSNTVLEAMAAGLPVIATAVGGNKELVQEGFNGKLVPVAEPLALAAALTSLLEDSDVRIRYGVAARQWVGERFDWSRTVLSYLQVYDDLLQLPKNTQLMGTG